MLMPGARSPLDLQMHLPGIIVLVHGYPMAGGHSVVQSLSGEMAYVLDRDYSVVRRAGAMALQSGVVVTFPSVLIDRIFPDVA